jgi:uncharacterized membrane protein
MYELLLYVHILGGMLWVGGGIAIVALIRQVASKESHEAADHLVDQSTRIYNSLFGPAVILLLATGVTMVIVGDAWSFAQPWVWIALTLFAVAFIDGALIGGRMEKQLLEFREAGQQSSEAAVRLFNRYMRSANISILAWLGMLAMMVFKPGV